MVEIDRNDSLAPSPFSFASIPLARIPRRRALRVQTRVNDAIAVAVPMRQCASDDGAQVKITQHNVLFERLVHYTVI